MTAAPDRKAIYDPRTETVRTGDDRFIRIQDLYRALATLNAVQLDQLLKKARLKGAVQDPFETSRSRVVEDLVDLARTRPQFALPILRTARTLPTAGPRFEGLLRDRAFGSASHQQAREDHSREGDDDIVFDAEIGRYFFDTRSGTGEFQLFITGDQRTLTLSPGERFDSHEPYEICFVLVRTPDGRFWLRWPEAHRDIPAYYLERGEPVWFFPHPVDGEDLDFEELFPGHTYEVFGVQFQLPDIGTDYSVYYDDDLDAWQEWDPSEAKARREAQERAAREGASRDDAADARSPGAPHEESELARLLRILELEPGEVTTRKELSRHYRRLSLKVHPLKHLDADDAEKERIAERYMEITTAYNALKSRFQ
jgi:hypothetical protein